MSAEVRGDDAASGARASHLAVIRRLLRDAGADATFVTHPPHVRWATGFTGSNALLVVTWDAAHLVTDGRYRDQAADEVTGASVHVAPGPLADLVVADGLLGGTASVLFDSGHTTVAQLDAWRSRLPSVDFFGRDAWLAESVATKDEAAVAAMRHAQASTVRIFEDLLGWIAVGRTEREVAAWLVHAHLSAGASAMSFEPIVASGPNGALPHARPSDRLLAAGELVVIDVGGVFDGMCSDFTRTIALGEPGDEARADHAAVARAHDAGVAALRAGVSGAEADRDARKALGARADFFTHSLGHGVGAEVHEWPRLSQQADHVIPAGATVTVEPGVYRPGRWGIRTESLVVVRDDGAEILAPFPTDLIVV
jgi:Xaa-Pro aminopeptidase